MLKKLLIFLLAAVMIVSICGCAKETTNENQAEEPFVVVDEEADPFYNFILQNKNVRPIALMIDNDTNAARPQIGLESAYLVYEMVVEGSATRFMALFKDHSLEKVGPIRSSRHYFLDYAMENDAIYAHAGWSPKAMSDISSLKINNINGVAGDSDIYWRDNTYDSTWHNLYTSLAKLSERADKKEYRRTTDTENLTYNKLDEAPNGKDVTEIYIPYAGFYKVKYVYDEASMRFVRYVNGNPHTSQTGENLSTKNIIMYSVKNVNLQDGDNKGRQDLKNIGSGTGYYFSDGKVVEINWEKTARDKTTKYTLKDGTPLVVNPGNTYIQIVPENIETAITYKAEPAPAE